jgi:small subunit ribosomal protein S20
MANHKSAIKRHKQSLKRKERNKTTMSACRTAIKKVRAAVEAGDMKAAQELLVAAEKSVATAASKGIYHKNNAARKISRIAGLVAKAKAA